jgi:hypothetical protein
LLQRQAIEVTHARLGRRGQGLVQRADFDAVTGEKFLGELPAASERLGP